MKNAGKMLRREEIEFFLRLHGLWEGVLSLPPPPDPPYDIESIEKRRGVGGVLDGGEAEARKVSPPGGAGESTYRRPAGVGLGGGNRTTSADLVALPAAAAVTMTEGLSGEPECNEG
jgi:hypothetical protein